MARRLTDQQRRRIAMQQARRRHAVDGVAPDETQLGAEQEALVIAHYGSQLDVETQEQTPRIVRCFLRANLTPLVTGDRVIAKLPLPDDHSVHTGIVVAGCARRTLLSRPDARGVLRSIAANVDAMIITIAPVPEPFPFLIDRYLVAANMYGIQGVLVCNKNDLLQGDNKIFMDDLLQRYRSLGIAVFCLSAHNGDQLETLQDFLRDKTVVIVGQSGVGKSSLIQALLPEADIAIGDLSTAIEKGRHTTTTARLYHLPTGGDMIDSPGIREFTLPVMPAQELLAHFADLHAHAAHCRFRDCQHEHEPDCAVLAAEQSGAIFPERLASYRHILASFSQ
jgi:ribosome biogenesis GTPase